jgi:carboxyl-terminal processing protease
MRTYRLFLWLVVAIILGSAKTACFAQESQDGALKFGRLLRLVESYYVDTTNIPKLTETAIVALLQELDPHSVYISKADVEKMNEPLVGNFEGIGITFNILRDTLLVSSVVPGGPSEKTGLLAGDRIIFIDGKSITNIGLTNNDVFAKLRGPKGTRVELKIMRKNVRDLLDFTIIRDKIPLNSLDAAYMLDKETGYVKLNRFSATTVEEFVDAIQELKANKVQNLILDLRGNGGGYLNAATELAEEFLPANKMIVYTEGIHSAKRDYKSAGNGIFEEGKLVILTNEGSASASEIVAGAVQDWDRGVIIGRRTYGKGLVQQPYYLTDGSMVRLTTAHYYTPSGRCIQRPYNNGIEDYRTDLKKRFDNGELFHADSISFPDSLKYKTLASGRTVYGGGGIMPDVFVALDTLSSYHTSLERKNVIYNWVLDYIDLHRSSLKRQFPDFSKFNSGFSVTDEMLESVVKKGENEKIPRDPENIKLSATAMKKEIKAYIARDMFNTKSFYQVFNQDDATIMKALELIRDQNLYKHLLVSK